MRLLGNKILVKILTTDGEVSKGGLFIPDMAKRKYRMAEVVQVGTKVKESIEVGDKMPIPYGVGIEVDKERFGGDLILTEPEKWSTGICLT